MSFATDLYTVLHADPSLNEWCSAGIHYENLPENFEINKDWIVYSFNKQNQGSCLGSVEAFTTYNMTLKIVATDTIRLETINDRVVEYLNGNHYNGIQDFLFISDSHTLDLDKNIYMNTLQFNVLYC